MKPCPVCESNNITDNFIRFRQDRKDFTLLRCNACTGIFYDNEFFFDFKENFEHNRSLKIYIEKTSDIEELITVAYNFATQLDKGWTTGIDIGCGAGLLMDFTVTVLGKKMTGFEPSIHYSKEARKILGLDIIEDFFQPELLKANKQDLVLCFQVLQLTPDPAQLLKDIRSVLTPNGAVLFSTPDNEGIESESDVPGHFASLSPGVHRFIFNKRSLEIAFKNAGFPYQHVLRQNGQLFAIASLQPLPPVDLFKSHREIVLSYYITKLASLSKESLYYKGIWYRLFRNRIDNGEYRDGLDMLTEAYWFEMWAEDEIESIRTLDRLYELNSSADAIIYYYTGILLLNHLQNQRYAEKYFLLSFLLCSKIIQIQPDMSSIEKDIVWLAKLHQVLVQLNQGKRQEANNEIVFMLTHHSETVNHLPPLPAQIRAKAESLLR